MADEFKNKGYILHPSKGKIPFFCNFATIQDLEDAISKLNSLTPIVVDQLPEVGEAGYLYFVPNGAGGGEDQSKEYIWVDGRFELVGSTGVDLSAYVSTDDTPQSISGEKTFAQLKAGSLKLEDTAQLSLGEGAEAVIIHGDGTSGLAAIEGGNNSTLDVAVPVNFTEPVSYADTVSYLSPGTQETVLTKWTGDKAGYELRLRGTDGALRLTKAGGGDSIFSTGTDGHMYSLYWFTVSALSVNTTSTFNGSVTMRSVLMVAGATTIDNTLSTTGKAVLRGGLETYGETNLGSGLPDPTTVHGDLTVNNSTTLNGGLTVASGLSTFEGPASFKKTVEYISSGTTGEPIYQKWTMPRVSYTLKGFEATGALGFANADGTDIYFGLDSSGNISVLKNLSVAGATTFSKGVTINSALTVSAQAMLSGGIAMPDNALVYFGPLWNIGASGNNLNINGTIDGIINSNNPLYIGEVDNCLTLRPVDDGGGNAHTALFLSFKSGGYKFNLYPTNKTMRLIFTDSGTSIMNFSPNSQVTFTGAVTCNTSLTVQGSSTFSGQINAAGLASFGAGIEISKSNGGPTISANGGTVTWSQIGNPLSFQIADSNAQFGFYGGSSGSNVNITKPNAAILDGQSLLNRDELDARYAKIVALTKDEYTALAAKDDTTIYLITDTTPKMWAIGDMEIVTSDMPA